jgi:hypothetical protein
MSPEFTGEEALQVTVILGVEEEKCRYASIDHALALSIAQLHRPPPPSARDGTATLDAAKAALHAQERRQGL